MTHNLPILLLFVIEVIHVASFGSVEGVHGLPVLGGPDVNQLPGVLQDKVSFLEPFARLNVKQLHS